MERRLIKLPPNFAPEIGGYVWALQDTRQRTLRALEGIEAGVLDWFPGVGGNSIGTLLYHIAAIEADWLFADILEGREFPEEVARALQYDVRDDQDHLVPVLGESLAQHLERLALVRRYLLDALRAIDADDFRRQRHFETYSVTPEWVLHHLMQREAEHRGQIGALRALAGQINA